MNTKVIGPFCFTGSESGKCFLQMLQDKLIPQPDILGSKPEQFMQEGAPPHYVCPVHHWLHQTFPECG